MDLEVLNKQELATLYWTYYYFICYNEIPRCNEGDQLSSEWV